MEQFDLETLKKSTEEIRERNRRIDTVSWIAVIASFSALIISILRLLPLLLYILR